MFFHFPFPCLFDIHFLFVSLLHFVLPASNNKAKVSTAKANGSCGFRVSSFASRCHRHFILLHIEIENVIRSLNIDKNSFRVQAAGFLLDAPCNSSTSRCGKYGAIKTRIFEGIEEDGH
jgi:hypothetical protein